MSEVMGADMRVMAAGLSMSEMQNVFYGWPADTREVAGGSGTICEFGAAMPISHGLFEWI